MPQINLLPTATKKRVPKFFPAGGSLELSELAPLIIFRSSVCAGICILLWLVLLFGLSRKEKALVILTEKVSVLATNPEAIEKLKKERAVLEKKVRVIENLSSRKFFWYEKLDLIARLIPEGVWLTEMYSNEERTQPQEEADSSGNQLSALDTVTVLVIKGMAFAPKIQNAVGLIGNFITSLQSTESFAKDFAEIKLNTATKGAIGSTDVMNFDFLCETK